MNQIEVQQGEYIISTDKKMLDLSVIHDYLSNRAYWAIGRSEELVSTSIEHSLCFGVHESDGSQVGFARVVTDYATFAWICDVFILESHRAKGLGKWLVKTIVSHPELENLQHQLLATREAHSLYSKYGGFKQLQNLDRWMERILE
jgi:GNAT superfamily N-acetyltransferase